MKNLLLLLISSFLLFSCKSISDEVKKEKAKFIEIGLENSQPIDLNNLDYLYKHALFSSRDKKMKYLDVSSIETIFSSTPKDQVNLDSIVLFTKGEYLILYDFAKDERSPDEVKSLSKLIEFQVIDTRLYLGRK